MVIPQFYREWVKALQEPGEATEIVNYRVIRDIFPEMRARPGSILAFQQHYAHLLKVLNMGPEIDETVGAVHGNRLQE